MTTRTKRPPDPHAEIKAEREEATRLRGSHEQRQRREDAELSEKQRAINAAFNSMSAEKTQIEDAERILREDLHRQRRKIAALQRQRDGLQAAKRSSTEVAHAAIERLRHSAAKELADWLPRLKTLDDPAVPGPGVAVAYLLTKDDGFAGWLRDQASAFEEFDPRDTAAIDAELAEVRGQLAEAEAEYDRRNDRCVAAQHALTAADRGNERVVAAFLESVKGMA